MNACPSCHFSPETIEPIFFECPAAVMVWKSFMQLFPNVNYHNIDSKNFWNLLVSNRGGKAALLAGFLLWLLWTQRNAYLHKENTLTSTNLWTRGLQLT